VPAVVPNNGVFKEMSELTRALLLFETGSPESLRSALERLQENPEQLRELRSHAQSGVRAFYSARAMAEGTLRLLRTVATGA